MLNAFKENANKYQRIVLVGTDCPFITKGLINKAFAALSKYEIVIGPSEDGGYYLIGLAKFIPKLFKNISWSTNKVLSQTKKRCRLSKINPFLLKKLYDIDTMADYNQWRRDEKLRFKQSY
jgi:glycosyltransferase A (GT-A) superfamily protein (DUF2064 family)